MIEKIAQEARSVRRFDEGQELSRATLTDLVAAVRLVPSTANLQCLKFRLVHNGTERSALFPLLGWAGYLSDWPGPVDGERPGGYIVVLRDRNLKAIERLLMCDVGIAGAVIQLRGRELALGACMIGSFKEDRVSQALSLSPDHQPLLVVALGVPREDVVIEPIGPDESIRYYRDESEVHHVPKRSLEDLVVG